MCHGRGVYHVCITKSLWETCLTCLTCLTASKFRNLGFRTQHIYYSPSSQPHTYRKTPRLSNIVLGNSLGGGTKLLNFESS